MKKKMFLPMIIAVIITILIYLFTLLFIDNFDEMINYIFISIIYFYLYINSYLLFNNFCKKKEIFIIFNLGIVLLIVSIWELLLKIKITNIYLIIPLGFSVILIFIGVLKRYNILKKVVKKRKNTDKK